MKHCEHFFIVTSKKYQIIDITGRIERIVKTSKIKNGEGKVRTYHTTTTLLLNENEEGLFEDIGTMVRGITKMLENGSRGSIFFGFEHDDIEKRRKRNPELSKNECKNALAHLLAILIGSHEISFEIVNGKIDLGTYQRILFIEFDEKPICHKERKIGVRVIPDEEEITTPPENNQENIYPIVL